MSSIRETDKLMESKLGRKYTKLERENEGDRKSMEVKNTEAQGMESWYREREGGGEGEGGVL